MVVLVVLGLRLDLVIVRVFSSPKESAILCDMVQYLTERRLMLAEKSKMLVCFLKHLGAHVH